MHICASGCRFRLEFVIGFLINIFTQYANYLSKKAINRLKVVLAEKNVSSKWLAEQLGKNEVTVSRLSTNDAQPSLNTLVLIAKVLNINTTDLINNNCN